MQKHHLLLLFNKAVHGSIGFDKGTVYALTFPSYHALFDAQPLSILIKNTYTEDMYQALLQSRKALYLTTVCLQTGRITYFTNSDQPMTSSDYDVIRVQNSSTFRRAMFASSCQPVFMPPYKVIEQERWQYVDGGLRDMRPSNWPSIPAPRKCTPSCCPRKRRP